jgi:hypothetical protein
MSLPLVAVIADLVDSRLIVARDEAQVGILDAFALVDERVEYVLPLRATVGDEFQAVYPSVAAALEATLLARLALPAGIDCRFGIGLGQVVDVGKGTTGVLQDGSAWWLAREAINEAHRREDTRTPSLRGWFRADGDNAALESVVNAYLLSRDHIVGGMSARARRLTFGTLRGMLQGELAEAEGISQPAVSQTLRRSGAVSLVAAIDELAWVAG